MHRKISVAVAATLTIAPVAVLAQDSMISVLFNKATEVFAGKGFAPTGWEQTGELKQGAEQRLTVKLTGGSGYTIVGVCDSDCKDMDIQLLDVSGAEVARDEEEDDFPIVEAPASGTYTARVAMVSCSASPCAFGVKAYRK
ncbi:hypothetical protein [Sphingomonas hengshuiensis]|uniref:hypothetical protein n=1 Tax=Sphingomonas hengshuiensis TaxID=1609977 RepID=UPI0006980FBE|nr:hypothetical protein [Sphingomonas hengshuiensis]